MTRKKIAKPGLFVTFEGGEGAGKSTQIARLSLRLRQKRYRVVTTREPGGTPGAEAVRHVVLSGAAEPLGSGMEALLFAAARADHVDQVIRPAVIKGQIVLCDRFVDSTRVYQGGEDGLEPGLLRALERSAIAGLMPDLTLVFDIDPAEGLRRARERNGSDSFDRFERERLAVHEARRQAFLTIARAEPQRCRIIEAWDTTDHVEHAVTDAFFAALDAKIAAQAATP